MSMIRAVAETLLDVVFPKHCPVCDEVTVDAEPICDECAKRLEAMRLDDKVCRKCGLPKVECTCKTTVFLFDGIAAPYRYEDAGAEAALNIKKKRSYENAAFFASRIAERVRLLFPDVSFDAVTSVPMTSKKRRKTDFDHAAVLARYLAAELDLPFCAFLRQTGKNAPQHELPRDQRRANVRGIYSCAPHSDPTGKTLLLVDDIKTSGASLNECSHVLRLAGAEAVYAATVAVVCKKTL